MRDGKCSKKLSIIGGILLFTGLIMALCANNYTSNVNILLSDRVIVKDLDYRSPPTLQIKDKIKMSNTFFIIGSILTGLGIILQIMGTAREKNN